jgi:hypothetical protein
MNLFRADVTRAADVVAELERMGVSLGAQQIVGLCPATAAGIAADGRVLEGRLAAAAAAGAAARCDRSGGDELRALAVRLRAESAGLERLGVGQDSFLAGAERAAALVPVLAAAHVLDGELEALLATAARGLRAAVSPATAAIYGARVAALDARLNPAT